MGGSQAPRHSRRASPRGSVPLGQKPRRGVQKLPTAGLQPCWGHSADTKRQAEAVSILSDSQGCGRSMRRGLT